MVPVALITEMLMFHRSDLLSVGAFPAPTGIVLAAYNTNRQIKGRRFSKLDTTSKKKIRDTIISEMYSLLYNNDVGTFSELLTMHGITSTKIGQVVKNLVYNTDDTVLKGKPNPVTVVVPPNYTPFLAGDPTVFSMPFSTERSMPVLL